MPLALTDRLDHGSAAQGRFHQTISAKSFPRFAEMVLESDGSLEVDVEVERSSAGIALLNGRVMRFEELDVDGAPHVRLEGWNVRAASYPGGPLP